jgi:hypothetical protein
MSPKQFNDGIAKLRLSVYAAAPVLGISLRQAQRYSSGEQVVAEPVANYLTVLIGMIDRWKQERKKMQGMIDFFEKKGGRIGAEGKDETKRWLATFHERLAEWEELLRKPPNLKLPPQID